MHNWIRYLLVSTLLLSTTATADYQAATGAEPKISVISVDDYHAVLELFEELQYTDKSWLNGSRQVPRIYLATIPEQWGKVISKEIDVTLKKRMFFRALGPLTLRSNELILQDRKRLLALQNHSALSEQDQAWVRELAAQYRLDSDTADVSILIAPLLLRVDIIPPSLILAQAAEESGWGTSRFAFAGNALFGQWTWGGDGITPAQQRAGMGHYQIARFDSPLLSVQAHARNLNSHPAYEGFRALRARKHAAGKKLSGMDAATTLEKYSERGLDYVKSLQSIISYNKLKGTDDAYFRKMHAIVLVPKGTE